MFCKNCGQNIEDSSKFCKNCGYKRKIDNIKKNDVFKNNRNKIIIKIIVSVVIITIITLISSERDNFINKSIEINNNAINDLDKNNDNLSAIDKFKSLSNENLDKENKINTLKNLAYAYLAENNNSEALKSFQDALDVCDYKSFDYYLINGEINNLQNFFNEALNNYEEAYKLESDNFQINNALGLFYMDLEEKRANYRDYNVALQYNKKASELNQELETMKENLAINYFLLEDYENSLKLFLQTSLNNKALNNYYIGLIYLLKENNVLAKEYFQKAVDLNIENDIGLDSRNELKNYLNNNL